jgi:hypothetical protein
MYLPVRPEYTAIDSADVCSETRPVVTATLKLTRSMGGETMPKLTAAVVSVKGTTAQEWHFHVAAAHVLQSEAWDAFNHAYHAADGEKYREIGRMLYRRGLHERIQALFVKGDEQNLLIEEPSIAR